MTHEEVYSDHIELVRALLPTFVKNDIILRRVLDELCLITSGRGGLSIPFAGNTTDVEFTARVLSKAGWHLHRAYDERVLNAVRHAMLEVYFRVIFHENDKLNRNEVARRMLYGIVATKLPTMASQCASLCPTEIHEEWLAQLRLWDSLSDLFSHHGLAWTWRTLKLFLAWLHDLPPLGGDLERWAARVCRPFVFQWMTADNMELMAKMASCSDPCQSRIKGWLNMDLLPEPSLETYIDDLRMCWEIAGIRAVDDPLCKEEREKTLDELRKIQCGELPHEESLLVVWLTNMGGDMFYEKYTPNTRIVDDILKGQALFDARMSASRIRQKTAKCGKGKTNAGGSKVP